jgi:hypothetical protein
MNAFIIEIPVLEKEHTKMKKNNLNQVFDGIFFKLDENQPAQKLTFGIFNETNDLNELIFWNLNPEVSLIFFTMLSNSIGKIIILFFQTLGR